MNVDIHQKDLFEYMDNNHNLKNSTLLFIPEVAIYPFARGLSVLGSAVKKQGNDVFITKCSGQMLRCPMMSMHRLSANPSPLEKSKICKKCSKSFKTIQNHYNFLPIDLSQFIDEKILKEVDELVSMESENIYDTTFRGFPVGKIAQYDFILETKYPYSKNLSKEHKEIYLAYIKNTALTIALTDNIIKHVHPSLLLTFNEYAQCQAVRYAAEINNVRRMAITYPVHFNVDTSRFMIWKSTCEYWRYNHCQKWNSFKNIPIKFSSVMESWEDAIFRMYSFRSHAFSTQKTKDPINIFKKLNLNSKRKTVVVYTSSQDERGSVEIAMKIWGEDSHITDAFPNQIEWLSMLRDYVEKRDDVQIIVRIHPREGTKQFGFDSQHLKQLKEKFKINNLKFIIIWPDDPVSSYDLLELADVCLVSWSLMGQEAAKLGIPVLAITGNMFYPDDDFIQVGKDVIDYKNKLDSILEMKYGWEHLLKTARFYHWRIFITSLNLNGLVSKDVENNTIWPEIPLDKTNVINNILSGKQDLIEYNIKQWQDSLLSGDDLNESEAMRKGIRLFLDKLFCTKNIYEEKKDLLLNIYQKIWRKYIKINLFFLQQKKEIFEDYVLEFSTDSSRLEEFCQKTKKNKKLSIFLAEGVNVTMIRKGKKFSRMSPVVVRLAKLYVNSLQEKL